MTTKEIAQAKETLRIAAMFAVVIAAVVLAVPWVFGMLAADDAVHPAGQPFAVAGWVERAGLWWIIAITVAVGSLVIVIPRVIGVEKFWNNGLRYAMGIVFAVVVAGTPLVSLLACEAENSETETAAFIVWADARYGVDLSGLDDDAIRSLYDPEDDFTRVRNPDTGEFVTSRTDTRGTVLVERVDAEELPTKGQ